MDKFIGKVILVNIPKTKRPQHRWIVSKKENGRYVVRAPKISVKLSDLKLCRENDYGKETILPNESTAHYTAGAKRITKRSTKRSTKRRTNRSSKRSTKRSTKISAKRSPKRSQ